jgi:hypothetical protein
LKENKQITNLKTPDFCPKIGVHYRGYGDSITFNSLINNKTHLSINYTDWKMDPPNKYIVDLNITKDGKIK